MAGNNGLTKQVILMREDLSLSSGKMMAQASHASLSAILNKNKKQGTNKIDIDISEEESEWFNKRFTKIVLGVKSEEELMLYYNKAVELGLNVSKPIMDAGFTELDKPTLTCIAIGPNYKESIDGITKDLRVFSGTIKDKKIKKLMKRFLDNPSNNDIANQLKELLD